MNRAPDYLIALVENELSEGARLGRIALLVTAAMATAAVGLLGGANSSLPSSARMIFGLIGAIGVLSSASGLRTLSNRGALLARQRVTAARTGVALAAGVTLAALVIGWANSLPAAYFLAGFGGILLVGTLALLRQEHRKLATLTARRHALAQQLKKDPS